MFQFNITFPDGGSEDFDVPETRGERVIWYSLHHTTAMDHCKLMGSGDELPPDHCHIILVMWFMFCVE
jgi:hypothetical protein